MSTSLCENISRSITDITQAEMRMTETAPFLIPDISDTRNISFIRNASIAISPGIRRKEQRAGSAVNPRTA